MQLRPLIAPLLATALFGACGEQAPTSAPSGARLSVEVAPLTLPGLVEATYQLTVKNAGGETVWTAGPLASTQYGNGQGALTYIGTCDADGGLHTVELVLLSLTDETGLMASPADYVNPTIGATGTVTPLVVSDVVCRENADTLVPIELTIMRSARQGFFDFAVEFDDVFCSAKLDCSPSMLHNSQGERAATAILAFACAAGTGQQTYLYLSDLTLTCTDANGTTTQTLTVDGAAPGQQGAQGAGIFQWGVYQGQEFLAQADLEKCYWNHAIGLDLTALTGKTCRLSATGAASDTQLALGPNGYVLPQTGSYPYISWDAEVLTGGTTLCENMALNASAGAVETEYVLTGTPAAELPALTALMQCGTPDSFACTTGAGTVTVTGDAAGFTLSATDGTPAKAFTLPTGYAVANSCCTPGCCQPAPAP